MARISHYLRKGTCQVKHSRSITIGNIATANTVGHKSVITSIPSVIPSCSSSSANTKSDTSLPNTPADVVRSYSISSLDKTHKSAQTSTASRPLRALHRRQLIDHQQHEHFIAARTAAESSNNRSDNANATESALESSRTFRETDRDSISSASSLEILVQ